MNDDTKTESLLPDDELSRSVFVEFIDESLDALNDLDTQLIYFESHPSDLGAINAIFRPIHSVKGNSAFFGMMKTKKIAHELEDLLDLLRKEKKRITPELMTVLLKGFDMLRGIFERVRGGGPELTDETIFNALLEEITVAITVDETTATVWPELIDKLDRMFIKLRKQDKKLVDEVEALLSQLRQEIPALADAAAAAPASSQPAGPLDRLMAAAQEPLESDKAALKERAEKATEALEALQDLSEAGSEAAAKIKKTRETLETFKRTVGFDDMLASILREEAEALSAYPELLVTDAPSSGTAAAEQQVKSTEAPSEAKEPAGEAKAAPRAGGEKQSKTLRISEEQLDVFLSYVGELVVVGKMFNYLHADTGEHDRTGSSFASRFRQVNETFEDLSANLQRSIMALRRMPLKNAFSKIPRLVHDVASQKGKDVKVLIEDRGVLVDKSIIDMLDAPLTHMVRNAADHGIELPADREAAGKPRQGTVRITATEESETILLEISDDGAGLNVEALHAKGVEMGLLAANRDPTMEEITKVLFAPGVSTSKEITDISGRGVGMDVVLRAIESSGGSIKTSTTKGKGTIFTIVLSKSVSTQILHGFLVRTGGNVLVLPMERVDETAQVSRETISTVKGIGRCVQRHGQIIPLFSLGALLDMTSESDSASRQTIVVVNMKGSKKALAVDELVGVQQVVVKPIEGLDNMLDSFSGGALMGDGSVALVLDLDVLNLQ